MIFLLLPPTCCARSTAGPSTQSAARPPAELEAAISPTPTPSSSAARPKSPPHLIAAAPKLRVIARAGTGVDNVDLDAASARGIVVMNAPGANSISVAELAIGLDAGARAARCRPPTPSMKRGKWEKKKFAGRRAARQDARPRRLRAASARKSRRARGRSAWRSSRTIRSSPRSWPTQLGVAAASTLDDVLCGAPTIISLHMPATAGDAAVFERRRGWRAARRACASSTPRAAS